MKIRYLSDLHLEFFTQNKLKKFLHKFPVKKDAKEICILAGDIGNIHQKNNNYDDFMKFISDNFEKTFVIPGNHEYYNNTKTFDETNVLLENYYKKFNNISFLNNKYEIYKNYCFVGTTLWSKITNPSYEINDVYSIPNFDYIKYNRLNRMCVDFLEDAVYKNNNCIIITHHMPSQRLVDIKYKTSKMLPYNQWFYCDMDKFIDTNKDKIKCWIYGHTHTPNYAKINDIPFVCNPIGYPNENSTINLDCNIILDDVGEDIL